MVTLLCTVRGCRAPLSREGRRLICPSGHSFDLARSGYCNLLQPQDRRSLRPGDSREAVRARRSFLQRPSVQPLIAAIAEAAGATGAASVLDVGCGEGTFTDALRVRLRGETHGVDISVPALDAAARRYAQCTFLVGNADRFLPYADSSFALVASITARMHPAEFQRVLIPGGRALIVVPAADDLVELRAAVLGEGKHLDRTVRTETSFAGHFALEEKGQIRITARLDGEAIHDVMASSYRGLRSRQRERLSALADLDVTLSRDVFLFTSLRRS